MKSLLLLVLMVLGAALAAGCEPDRRRPDTPPSPPGQPVPRTSP